MLSINNKEHIFEQRYRPQSISECILPSQDKQILTKIVESGKIPHMILVSSSPGTGKTTVAKALCHDTDAEMLFVNGSDCKIDFVRGPLTNFATAASIDGKKKVIVIDEFDRSGLAESQRHMRSFLDCRGDSAAHPAEPTKLPVSLLVLGNSRAAFLYSAYPGFRIRCSCNDALLGGMQAFQAQAWQAIGVSHGR